MTNNGRRRERRVGATNPRCDFRMQRGHPLHVRLVDYEVVSADVRPPLVTPIVRGIDHHALGHRMRTVSRISAKRRGSEARARPEHRIVPLGRPIDRTRIWIEQQLCGIEAMPRGRIVGTGDAIAIALSRTNARNVPVPDMLGSLDKRYSSDFVISILSAKQAKGGSGCMLGKQREVCALAVEGGAERISRARSNF